MSGTSTTLDFHDFINGHVWKGNGVRKKLEGETTVNSPFKTCV